MKKIALGILLLFLLNACSNKESKVVEVPGNILMKDTFIVVMTDFRLAEAAIRQTVAKGEDVDKVTKYYYNFMLQKHKISMKDFKASLMYYSKDPENMDKIYSEIVNKLSEIKGIPTEE